MIEVFRIILSPLKLLTGYRLFQRDEYPVTFLQIILWWEARRPFFNVVVGIAGAITIVVILFSAAIAEKLFKEPIGWPDPPFLAIIGVVLYAVGANVCYTGGWIVELISREVWGEKAKDFAEISFTLGIVFSFFDYSCARCPYCFCRLSAICISTNKLICFQKNCHPRC